MSSQAEAMNPAMEWRKKAAEVVGVEFPRLQPIGFAGLKAWLVDLHDDPRDPEKTTRAVYLPLVIVGGDESVDLARELSQKYLLPDSLLSS